MTTDSDGLVVVLRSSVQETGHEVCTSFHDHNAKLNIIHPQNIYDWLSKECEFVLSSSPNQKEKKNGTQ